MCSSDLIVQYEDFCQRPEYYFDEIISRLIEQEGIDERSLLSYCGEECFSNTNVWRLTEYSQKEAEQVYKVMSDRYE